jgi:hypothetical protein
MPNNDININRFSNRHRLLGDPAGNGAPTTALTAELAHNENDQILYIGTGNDGAGNATAIVPIAGEGHFSTRAYAESLTGGVQSSLDAEVTARQTAVSDLSSRVDAIVSNTDVAALDSLSEVVTAFQQADSDLNGAISALGTSATSALGAEVTRAQAAEAELASDISDEEDARIAADNLLAADITNLTSRANTNDTRSTSIETAAGIVEGRVSEAESDIVAIENAATTLTGRVSTLESDLASEVSRAEDAEAELESDLADEVSRAQAAEAQLTSDLAAEVTARAAAVSSEQTRAEAAESALADDIASETTAREAAVAAEVTAREAAVSAEATARGAAISAETTAREAAISSVNTRIDNVLSNIDPAALDSLTEVVSAFQSADGDLSDTIANLTSSSAAAVAAEETRALAVEADLQNQINTNKDLQIADHNAHTSRIDAVEASLATEVSARESAVSALQTALDNEVTRAQNAESQLSSDLANEVTSRTSDVQSVRDVTDNHETRLSSAEGTIAGLGTMSTQNSSNVSITGGSISGVNLQASSMEISGAGSTALFVGAAGSVGIGTEAPSTALDVVGSVTVSQDLIGSGTSVLRGFILGGGTF